MRKSPLLFVLSAFLASAVAAQDFDCMMEAHEIVDIRSPVEGLIESIAVQRGERVRKGQVLAALESRAERATLESARARVGSLGSTIQAAEARLVLARQKLERVETLLKENFISQNARDEAAAEAKVAEAQVKETTANKNVSEIEVQRAEALLAMRTLRSPLDGVVMDRYLKPGELATTDGKQPILKLASIDPLHVEVALPLSQLGKVRAKQRAEIIPETAAGQKYGATVALIDSVVDARSGTFGVRLLLPNPGNKLTAGVKCKIRFQ